MSRLDRKVKRLQRRNSQSHAFFLLFLLIVAFGVAVVARYYALEPVQITDSSMTPKFKEQSVVWICKLPQCAASAEDMDFVLAKTHGSEAMVRKILATPGDTISISDKGKVITPHRNFKWKNEDAFIQSRTIYVPKAGDTLYFDKLNDVEQDYLVSYLRYKGESVFLKTTLWQGDHEINIDRVGATKIANRQVSLKEVDFLPWQDRYLIEMQIRQSEPGNAPIKLKRKLFRKKSSAPAPEYPQDSLPTQDSAIAQDSVTTQDSAQDSVPDTTKTAVATLPPPKPAPKLNEPDTVEIPLEEIADEINQIVIEQDCYFLGCEKGNNCPDSRELGYFTSDRIIGLHLQKPDEFKERIIEPAMVYVRGLKAIVLDLWNIISGTFKDAVSFAKETFSSNDETSEEDESVKENAEGNNDTKPKGKE